MRVLTTDEVRAAEREAVGRPGMSTLVLMQRAGTALAQFCAAHFKIDSVCVVCGKGNNGGDGLVAAEALRGIAGHVSVIILAADVSGLSADAAAMCARLEVKPIWVTDDAAFESEAVRQALAADLVIDAIFGTGFKPPLRGLPLRAVEAINNTMGTVVAVDLPTGVDADATRPVHETGENMVFAHGIATFIAPKPAHIFGDLTTGPVAVSEIGVPPVAVTNSTGIQVITGQEVGIAFPPRPRAANKGTFGHVLVVAGSLGKAGAAGLASLAALRTGAGLVTVACPKSIQATVAGFAPEVMTEGLAETADGTIAISAMGRVQALLSGKDALVLGPGISQNAETAEFARRLVANCRLPLVLDADGLNAFGGRYAELKPPKEGFRVLTPHRGEAARLLGISVKDVQADRRELARRMARETGSCAVLKGLQTIVAGVSGETWINMSGNPALAKGGTGDVLSGIIGAALARKSDEQTPGSGPDLGPPKTWMKDIYGFDPHEKQRKFHAQQLQHSSQIGSAFMKDVCVAAAVHLHGLAGDFARDMLHENTVLARDVIDHLAEAFRDCEQQLERELFYLQK
ncbi:MAG TPA: NAD(P)H-hydrate dehydratase [Candidatus Angelobacter sp.]|nr:NAD(P)H-hydrate dehydratase [Candidatus Angelobacter sp.]